MEKTIFLLRGLPGSGKTDFAFDLWEAMPATICSADLYMVDDDGEYEFTPTKLQDCHDMCWFDFTMAMDNDENCIVVDNTNVEVWEYQKYIDEGQKAGYIVRVLTVENHHNGKSIHGVPSETL